MLVASLCTFFWNEPPQQIEANINNQEETQTQVAEPSATVELEKAEPQPVKQKVVTPQPKPEVTNHTKPVLCEVYRPLLEKYNWNVNVALKVMDAESYGGVDGYCDQLAVGDKYPINGLYAPSCGLFQIRTLAGRPTCKQLHNAETNIAWAYKLWKGRPNWSDWTVCNKRIVNCY